MGGDTVVDEQGVEDGAEGAEVLFSILTDWGLLSGGLGASHRWWGWLMVQTECRQLVGEFVEDDSEGGAVVHKERLDVGVFIFQVGE